MLDWAGGGYWAGLVPEMTSEMEGSDCRLGESPSSECLRGSDDIMVDEAALEAVECWEKAGV